MASQPILNKPSLEIKPSDDEGVHARDVSAHIHWTGPVTMLGSLTVGLLLVIAHHSFYSYLDGNLVDNHFLPQSWVNNIATALAFLIRLTFVIASSTAYVQRQWLELRTSENRIKDVDTFTGIFSDPTHFTAAKTWFRKPLLMALAVVIWSMPVAVIFTPGTLSVKSKSVDNSTSLSVSTIAYDDLNLWIQTQEVSGYVSPTVELSRIAMASSTSGQILKIPSQVQNQSYSLEFTGPTLRCAVSENQGAFGEALKEGPYQSYLQGALGNINFLAFVAGDDEGYLTTNLTEFQESSRNPTFQTLDQISNDTARLYVLPGRLTYDSEKVRLIECQLYNATYNLDLSFAFPNQTISARSVKYLNSVNGTVGYCSMEIGTVLGCDTRAPHAHDHMAYEGVMDAFGSVIVGRETSTAPTDPSAYNLTARTSRALTVINWESTESASRGLEELFQNITFSTLGSAFMTRSSGSKISVPVQITTWPNVYVYAPMILLLSYGVLFAFASLCVGVGLYSTWSNKVSYQNQFSTFVRAAWNRNPNIDVWINPSDYGAAPLPEGVGEAKVSLFGTPSFKMVSSRSVSATKLYAGSTQLPLPTFTWEQAPTSRSATPDSDDGSHHELQTFI